MNVASLKETVAYLAAELRAAEREASRLRGRLGAARRALREAEGRAARLSAEAARLARARTPRTAPARLRMACRLLALGSPGYGRSYYMDRVPGGHSLKPAYRPAPAVRAALRRLATGVVRLEPSRFSGGETRERYHFRGAR